MILNKTVRFATTGWFQYFCDSFLCQGVVSEFLLVTSCERFFNLCKGLLPVGITESQKRPNRIFPVADEISATSGLSGFCRSFAVIGKTLLDKCAYQNRLFSSLKIDVEIRFLNKAS